MNAPQQLTASRALALMAAAPARGLAARTLFRLLERLQAGRLALTTPDGQCRVFAGREPGPAADLEIRDWGAAARILRGADIGLAECWRDGLVATSDMTALLHLCVANERALGAAFYGNRLVAFLYRLAHVLRPNTRSGSRRNIHAHYDLGNDFYALWLDRTMTYSAALFGAEDATLEAAQEAKYERLLAALEVDGSHHVLEIGCGWGGFAEYAARTCGCRVTGITISQAQLDFARARIRAAGLEDRVTLRFQDYRDLDGQFDRVVSIEMFEAVGERWWPDYFRAVHDRLVPGGRAAIQAITIDEAAFERYRRTSDFIREYVFPGGMLASVTRMREEACAAGLAVREPFRFGRHYAQTLRRWLARVNARADAIRALGFDERFLALWRFYLHYCEVGFDSGRTDVIHLEVARPA